MPGVSRGKIWRTPWREASCLSQGVSELAPGSDEVNLKKLFQEDKNPCSGNWVLFSALWVQFSSPSRSGNVY